MKSHKWTEFGMQSNNFSPESGIILSDGWDNYTLIKIIGETIILSEAESKKINLQIEDSFGLPSQAEVTEFCSKFLERLHEVSHYGELFDVLQQLSNSLPSTDFNDDIGLYNYTPMDEYRVAFLSRLIEILSFHITDLKSTILEKDLDPNRITNDINLFSAQELIDRVNNGLSKVPIDEQFSFLNTIKESVSIYLELFHQTQDNYDDSGNRISIKCPGAQRYWFTLSGIKFTKTERDNKDMETLLLWINERQNSIQGRTDIIHKEKIIEGFLSPILKLKNRQQREFMKMFFINQKESGKLAIDDIENLLNSRFYIGELKPNNTVRSPAYLKPAGNTLAIEIIDALFRKIYSLQAGNSITSIQHWIHDLFSDYKGKGYSFSNIKKNTDGIFSS